MIVQKAVSLSSTEAEYRFVAHTASKLDWTTLLLQELRLKSTIVPTVSCNNLSATYGNPKLNSKMKHVRIDFYFVRDFVANGSMSVFHVSSSDQLADLLIEPLSSQRFQTLCSKIRVLTRPQILRGMLSNVY